MDPELRTLLEAMRTEAAARDAETREILRAEIKATRAVAEAALQVAVTAREEAAATRRSLEAKIDEVQRQAGADREAVIHEIKALPDGMSTAQRQEADHLDADRERGMLNKHVLPLEASATNLHKRVTALENR